MVALADQYLCLVFELAAWLHQELRRSSDHPGSGAEGALAPAYPQKYAGIVEDAEDSTADAISAKEIQG